MNEIVDVNKNNDLEVIKKEYEERQERIEERYNTYYRIPQDYIQTVIINVSTCKKLRNVSFKGINEELILFNGKVIYRDKGKTDRVVSKYVKYWKYPKIAFQKTCFDAVIEYAKEHNIDFFKSKFLKIKLKFWGKGTGASCTVYELKELTKEEFIELCTKSNDKEMGNKVGSIKNKTLELDKETEKVTDSVTGKEY